MTAVDYINDPARLQAIIREALKCMDEGRHGDARFVWIPPCRAKLERDSDYPAAQEAA